MTQHDKQDNMESGQTPIQRSPAVIALTALCVLAAIASAGSLITRFLLIQWTIWAAAPAGFLLAFVLAGTFLLMIGKTAAQLVAGSVAIVIAVMFLWPIPARLAAQKRRHLQLELPHLRRPLPNGKYRTA